MSKVRNDVMKMINNRQKKNIFNKEKAAKRIGVDAIVAQFIEAVEKVSKDSKTAVEFNLGLTRETQLLEDHMRSLDKEVELTVVWSEYFDDTTWQNLAVDGIKVIWSNSYIVKNPDKEKNLYIDIGSLMIDGYFN